ncbi:NERD domain-containing protein [Gracilibacillus suaedae]|uniref:NERD domain-containing protein n=1 Tax=Gracilibacillus suaedae TaxID=2820273 RepID=UPI001ABEE3F7|nr:NERD domain-containing protein [Gracilibacillus suaedae]
MKRKGDDLLIVRPPQKTDQLLQLEVMQERYLDVPPNISESFGRELAGYLGEKSLPYFIDLITTTSHYDLYGLRLERNNHHFQIDGLFLFPAFFLITEIKHLKGKLFINEAHQMIQSKESEEKVYQHPLSQAKLQKEQLRKVLEDLGFESIPIYTLVIFTHDQAYLTFEQPDMIPVQQLPFRLEELTREFSDPRLGRNPLLQLSKKLVSMHRERPLTFLQPTGEVLRNIRRGVFCPKCKPLVMKWTYGTWKCGKCGYKDKNAHIPALIDFVFMFGYTINNRQARWFLLLDSIYTASRILKKLEVESYGGNNNKTYNLRFLLNSYKGRT